MRYLVLWAKLPFYCETPVYATQPLQPFQNPLINILVKLVGSLGLYNICSFNPTTPVTYPDT